MLGVCLESGLGLENLSGNEMNYHLNHKVHLVRIPTRKELLAQIFCFLKLNKNTYTERAPCADILLSEIVKERQRLVSAKSFLIF